VPAKGQSAYPHEKITEALALVVANQGNLKAAAEKAEVPEKTLADWVHETHVDEYVALDQKHAKGLEDEILKLTRENVRQAARVESNLLDKLESVQPREIPAALQAVASVKDKGISKMLALTGRDPGEGQQTPLVAQLQSLAKAGVLKVNVEIGPPSADVDSTAEELEP
jgi:hypothetical protein